MSVKIIAEVGANWETFEHCKDSIMQAKMCGADAVKFQLFDGHALYGMEWSSPWCMSPEWLPRLKDKADACGIEFMCSAFSPVLIDVVDPYVKTHKVASAELTHVRMLEKLAEIGKPVILSTGASADFDIRNALSILKPCEVTLLYCVSAYPARYVDFTEMNRMREAFGVPIGFSDHTTNIYPLPTLAYSRGAVVIEKHVNFVGVNSPDSPHSLSGDEFKVMIDRIDGGESFVNEENEMRTKHNRRLIATAYINVGEKLIEGENFGIYRSLQYDTKALSPWAVNKVNGQNSRQDLRPGDAITMDTVDSF